MQPFPHTYRVSAAAGTAGDIELKAEQLPVLRTASPPEFDGPGDRWSPETLIVGAVADCFILTFRAVAAASKIPWTSLTCDATGTLERVDGVTLFTRFDVVAILELPAGGDVERARRALEKAERNCLISNSLKGPVALNAQVHVAALA
jgi:peroxiredoxin-like protein